jgi:hypothetical protein
MLSYRVSQNSPTCTNVFVISYKFLRAQKKDWCHIKEEEREEILGTSQKTISLKFSEVNSK